MTKPEILMMGPYPPGTLRTWKATTRFTLWEAADRAAF